MQESLSVEGQEAVVDSQSPSLSAAAAAAAVKGPEMVDRRCHGLEKHLGRHGYESPGAFQLPFISVPSCAHAAHKWLFSGVDPHVCNVALLSEKTFATCVAPGNNQR